MQQDGARVAVIIPARNEQPTVGSTIRRVRVTIQGCEEITGVIIVVNDGSSDDTGQSAIAAGADHVLWNRASAGLGAAVRRGLVAAQRCGADAVVKIDADLQHSPEDIPQLLAPILSGEADLVFGDRFDRISYQMPILRRLGNRIFSLVMRGLTGWPVRDSQPGIFAGSKAYLDGFRIPDDYNYTQQVLIDAFQRGLRFASVPVSFRERSSGSSFVSLRYLWRVPWAILKMVVAVRPRVSPGWPSSPRPQQEES